MNLGYDSYYKIRNTEQKIEQVLPDVKWAQQELQSLLTVLKQYVHNVQDIYSLYNAKLETILKSLDHLTERVENNPETNFCLMFVAIGQGV